MTRIHVSYLLFYFLEAGTLQTADGVVVPVEGNQDTSGCSTDECQC